MTALAVATPRFQPDRRFDAWTVFDAERGVHIDHAKPWTEEEATFVADELAERPALRAAFTWVNDREEVVG